MQVNREQRRQARRKGMALAVLPVAMSAVGVGLAAQPAAASTSRTETVTISNPSPFIKRCDVTIQIQALNPYGQDPTKAYASTTVPSTNTNDACLVGIDPVVTTSVYASYVDSNGNSVVSPTTTTAGRQAAATYSNVGSNLITYHQVYFSQCNCSSPVYQVTEPQSK